MPTQKRAGTVDYTFPKVPKVDELAALDAEYERRSGGTGITYVSRPGDGSSVFHFGDGEHRRSRSAAIRHLRELIEALPRKAK